MISRENKNPTENWFQKGNVKNPWKWKVVTRKLRKLNENQGEIGILWQGHQNYWPVKLFQGLSPFLPEINSPPYLELFFMPFFGLSFPSSLGITGKWKMDCKMIGNGNRTGQWVGSNCCGLVDRVWLVQSKPGSQQNWLKLELDLSNFKSSIQKLSLNFKSNLSNFTTIIEESKTF